nr:MAG TPA: Rsm1-like [Caudoviricetes sp.]
MYCNIVLTMFKWTISSSTALPVLLCTPCERTYECQC